MELIVLAVPFLTTATMFLAKKLAGMEMFANGAGAKPFLRFSLVLFSLCGIVATSLLTGQEINPDSITSLAVVAIETVLSAFGSHFIYRVLALLRG
jgi:hypothetical protein